MSKKSKAIYTFLIRIIRETVLSFNLQHDFAWEKATLDFETGAIHAFRDCIPFVHLHGCHFHFCQSIFRQLSLVGLKPNYSNRDFPHFAISVRCVFALAFLPAERIENAFNAIVDHLEEQYDRAGIAYPDNLVRFISYIQRTWICENSKFSKDMWNVCNLRDRRTNNFVEGWHSLCLRHFGVGKNIWKFILRLQKIEMQTRGLLQQLEAGEDISNRKQYQKKKEQKIVRMMDRYQNGVYENDRTYLQALAHLQADFLERGEFGE